MIGALALAAVLVQPGDTLSGIASSHGVSLSAVEAANPQIGNPNMIFAGQSVNIPSGGGSWSPSSSSSSPSYSSSGAAHSVSSPSSVRPAYHSATVSSGGSSSGGGFGASIYHIPGVPDSFTKCVAFKESTNGQNQAFNGGVYGIINASGYHVNGASLATQQHAFAALYHQYGSQPWAPSDGCHG